MQAKIIIDEFADDDLFGQSKWWGSPDLPTETPYPCYTDEEGNEWSLTFVCQINCADLAAYDTPLPKEGLLCFFARLDYYLGYDDPGADFEGVWDKNNVKVIYVKPEDMNRLEQKILVDDNDVPIALSPRKIRWEVTTEGKDDDYGHKLLGAPFMIPWEDWDAPCEGWKVLLQVDSDEAEDYMLRFMDDGVFYVLINPADLEKGNFDNVRGFMVSM